MNNYNQIEHIKPLSNAQYEQVKSVALKRTKNSLGDKPSRKQFAKEHASLFGILDYLGVTVFLAAFAVSSVHIVGYAGSAANTSYAHAMKNVLGISIGDQFYGVVHQLGLLALAEAAMLLFFVLFRIRSGFEKWVSLVLAVMAMVFVITANLSSGLNGFLSLLAPVFTIGYGFRVEAIVTEKIKRDTAIDERYHAALTEYELVEKEPEKSSVYRQHLANEIIQKLASLKANADKMNDLTPDEKRLLCLREMERDAWVNNLDLPVPANNFLPIQSQLEHSSNGHNKIVKMNLEQ